MMNRTSAPLLGAVLAALVASSPAGAQQAIRAGQTVNGSLAASDPKLDDDSHFDLYVYRGRAGERITISMNSSDFDAMLAGGPTVQSGRVQAVDMDDDGGGGTNARMEATVPASGVYYFHANSLSGGQTGAYTLSVQAGGAPVAAADPTPTPRRTGGQAQPGTIRSGQTVNGSLAASDPKLGDDSHYDLYTYQGTPGENIEITMTSAAFDAYLGGGPGADEAIEGADTDDDGAGGTDARLRVQVPASGRYVIRANSLRGDVTGAYTLSVQPAGRVVRRRSRNEPRQTDGDYPAVRMGQSVTGRLEASDPKLDDGSHYDVFTYTGNPGDEIVITLSSTSFDPYLTLARMFGGDVERVAQDDDSGPGNNAQVRATLNQTGTYVIMANSFSANETGPYSLIVQRADQVPTSQERGSAAGMASLQAGRPVAGRLERSDPMLSDSSYADNYLYRGTPGEEVLVTMRSSDFDAFLTVASTDGEDLSDVRHDDDGAGGTNSQLRVRVNENGLYLVRANSVRPRTTGSYTLTVEPAPVTRSAGGSTAPQGSTRSQLTGKWVAGYPAVRNAQYNTMRQQVQAEQRMETFAQQLNANFPLPRNVPLMFGECGDPNAFYSPRDGSVTFCYEMIDYLNGIFSRSSSNPDELREAMDGAFAFIMMHEVGHALRHQLDLPVTGREEDAADQLAALVLLQDGDKGANAAVAGALALQTGNQFDDSDYADEHSLGPQRLYNIVCWIYGSDPQKYQHWVTNGVLPQARAVRCPAEYEQMAKAWTRLLGMHYDN
jgi:hypothetical protein